MVFFLPSFYLLGVYGVVPSSHAAQMCFLRFAWTRGLY